MLDQQRYFFGGDLDSDYLSAAEPNFRITPTLQMLSPSLDIAGDEEVRAAAGSFEKYIKLVSGRRRPATWVVQPALDATQVMPGHIYYLLSKLYENWRLYEKCRRSSVDMCFFVWRSRLCSMNSKALSATECWQDGGFRSEVDDTTSDGSEWSVCKSKLWGEWCRSIVLRAADVRGFRREATIKKAV